jgi:hypothetical protein
MGTAFHTLIAGGTGVGLHGKMPVLFNGPLLQVVSVEIPFEAENTPHSPPPFVLAPLNLVSYGPRP